MLKIEMHNGIVNELIAMGDIPTMCTDFSLAIGMTYEQLKKKDSDRSAKLFKETLLYAIEETFKYFEKKDSDISKEFDELMRRRESKNDK